MPLILLGLLVIIAVAAYWYFGVNGYDDNINPRDIGDRISDAAQGKATDIKEAVVRGVRKRVGIFDVDYDIEEDDDDDDNTIPFPSDAEEAKRRRNIH